MSKERVAIYAGTFDVFTNGHMWMVERGAQLFDRLVIAVGTNPFKKPLFTMEERAEHIRRCMAHLTNVEVDTFAGEYLFAYAARKSVPWILRGIRSPEDYAFEAQFQDMGRQMDPGEVETVFVRPPHHLASVSSSNIKGLIGYDGWETQVMRYVPAAISDDIVRKFREVLHAARA